MKTLLLRLMGFIGVGGAMTLLSMLLIAVTNEVFCWHPQCSYVFAYLMTLLLSYALNTKYVFHSETSLRKLLGYSVSYASGMLLGMLLLELLSGAFPMVNDTLLSYAIIPVTTIWNFVFVNEVLTGKVL